MSPSRGSFPSGRKSFSLLHFSYFDDIHWLWTTWNIKQKRKQKQNKQLNHPPGASNNSEIPRILGFQGGHHESPQNHKKEKGRPENWQTFSRCIELLHFWKKRIRKGMESNTQLVLNRLIKLSQRPPDRYSQEAYWPSLQGKIHPNWWIPQRCQHCRNKWCWKDISGSFPFRSSASSSFF